MSIILNALSNPQLVEFLMAGKIGVIPTDTLYGLVCAAANPEAVSRLYTLKDRNQKPGTIISASMEQLVNLGIKARYLKPVEQYWPGPVSVIVPSEPSLKYLDQGVGTLAVRIVEDESLRALLMQSGPLLTSSANHPGQSPANNLSEAQNYFAEEVDFYVDGNDFTGHAPSTVIRVVDDVVDVVRQGAVVIDEAGEIVGRK
jgi:tRNA threonylcarbamoyl adenosine modification protein (Sua5/YciO/YrdC/YwlC family)